MIFAVILFVTDAGPIGASAGRAVFTNRAACEQFLVMGTPAFDVQRVVLEAQTGAAVRYVAFCHDAGVPA